MEKNKNIITADIPGGLPFAAVSADALIQVVSNLLSNANDHTSAGHIRVSAAAGDGLLAITVEDDGEGIPPDLIGHVFERGVSAGAGAVSASLSAVSLFSRAAAT